MRLIFKIPLLIPLLLAFLLHAPTAHLQAQYFDPTMEGACPTPSTYGVAYGYFIYASALPGGQTHRLANKHCFSQELDVTDENTMDSSTPASTANSTYNFHVGNGRLNLKGEVKATGHRQKVPISGGTNNLNGEGSGNLTMWIKWVDTFTLRSASTKPVSKDYPNIEPAQIVEILVKLINNGKNVCTGTGSEGAVYNTTVLLMADSSSTQFIGGHDNLKVNSDCQTEQQSQGTIQVLANGKFRIEMGASVLVGGTAKHENTYAESVDVLVKLGEYQVCYQVVKGPKDLKITSASGDDYTCPGKSTGKTPAK